MRGECGQQARISGRIAALRLAHQRFQPYFCVFQVKAALLVRESFRIGYTDPLWRGATGDVASQSQGARLA